MSSKLYLWAWATWLVMQLGCTGSRWAMEDPDYANKYAHHTDDVAKTVKQAIDARHLHGKRGHYASLSGRDEPAALGGEVGGFYYPNPYTEGRLGLSGLFYDSNDPLSGGLLAGARLQTPSRLAPFVGVGVYGGLTPQTSLSKDGRDNNFNGSIDEDEEADNEFVAALIPEAGCHFWLTPGWRVTGSASYYLTSSSADDNFLMFSVSLARLSDLGKATSPRTLAAQARDAGWKIGDGAGYEQPGPAPPISPGDALFEVPLPLPPVNDQIATPEREASVLHWYQELIMP